MPLSSPTRRCSAQAPFAPAGLARRLAADPRLAVQGAAVARSANWQATTTPGSCSRADAKPTQDDVVFTFDDWQSGQSQGPYVQAPNHIVIVRERRWKLAKYYDVTGKKPPEWEMYDLRKDPLERHNLAHRPKQMTPNQKANFKRLKRRIHHLKQHRLQPLPS